VIVKLPEASRVRGGATSSRWRQVVGARGPGRTEISARPGWHRSRDEPATGDLPDQRPRWDVRGDPGPEGDRGGGQRGQRITEPGGLRLITSRSTRAIQATAWTRSHSTCSGRGRRGSSAARTYAGSAAPAAQP
jgi:hypothetical protein